MNEHDFKIPAKVVTPLTPRQTEVMREICRGKIGKEIAGEMGVSTRTVETHIQLAKRALGARNIVQAAVIFSNLKPETCLLHPDLLTPRPFTNGHDGKLSRALQIS